MSPKVSVVKVSLFKDEQIPVRIIGGKAYVNRTGKITVFTHSSVSRISGDTPITVKLDKGGIAKIKLCAVKGYKEIVEKLQEML